MGFSGGSDGKESACREGDLGLIPGSGRSPGEGNGNPLQYSCLENSMDRGAWWATVHGSQRLRHDLVTNTFTLHTIITSKGLEQLIPKCEMIWGKSGRFWGHRWRGINVSWEMEKQGRGRRKEGGRQAGKDACSPYLPPEPFLSSPSCPVPGRLISADHRARAPLLLPSGTVWLMGVRNKTETN